MIDKASMVSIPIVNIVIVGSTPLKGANTDMDGRFKLTQVQPGSLRFKVTYIGYKEVLIPNVVVTPGKEVVMEI
nr:carboxypeptidase-like regulatory domain-containing protein [Bacteroidota bacterium]